MTTYSVQRAGGTVIIALGGPGEAEIEPGYTHVGVFSHDVNEINQQTRPESLSSRNGDHPFVAKAKQVIADATPSINVESLTFLDRASNAPVHPEDGLTLDQMLGSDPATLPDVSSQKGGVASTVGTDPSETDPNGVTEAVERSDRGETSQTSEMPGGDAQSEEANPPNPSDPLGDAGDKALEEPGNKAEGITGPSGTEQVKEPEESEHQSESEGDQATETVAALKARLPSITDKDELEKLYIDEQNGPNRSTALAAIEARAKELSEAE